MSAINDFKQNQTDERSDLAPWLAASAERHRHLCPRQVLGIRMGLLGLRLLGLQPAENGSFNNDKKQLLTIVETDGCGADGVLVVTDCHIVRRTLRVMDYGKMAATFVNTATEKAVRVIPANGVRELALVYAPDARSHWHAYLEAYQIMPDEALLAWQTVQLSPTMRQIISRPGIRVNCAVCGEEIINEREVEQNGRILCRACAGEAYYWTL